VLKIRFLKLFLFVLILITSFSIVYAGYPVDGNGNCGPGPGVKVGDFCYDCSPQSDSVCPNDLVPNTCTDSNPDADCVFYVQCDERTPNACKLATQSNGENCQLCSECSGKQAISGNQCRLERSVCEYSYQIGKCGAECTVPGAQEQCPGGNSCTAPNTVGSCSNVCKGDYTCETSCVPTCSCAPGYLDTDGNPANGCETQIPSNCNDRSFLTCTFNNQCDWCKDCDNNQYSGGQSRCVDKGTCTRSCVLGQCTAECTSGQTQDSGVDYCSSGNINNQILGCGNDCKYSDGTAQDTLAQSCLNTCTETDNGQDFFYKGTVTDNNQCVSGSVCPSNNLVDVCNGGTLTEYYCSNNNAASVSQNCDVNSVNIDPATNTCSWSDGKCGDGACATTQGVVDCDAYLTGDFISSEAASSSCTLGCVGENCCKRTKKSNN